MSGNISWNDSDEVNEFEIDIGKVEELESGKLVVCVKQLILKIRICKLIIGSL